MLNFPDTIWEEQETHSANNLKYSLPFNAVTVEGWEKNLWNDVLSSNFREYLACLSLLTGLQIEYC